MVGGAQRGDPAEVAAGVGVVAQGFEVGDAGFGDHVAVADQHTVARAAGRRPCRTVSYGLHAADRFDGVHAGDRLLRRQALLGKCCTCPRQDSNLYPNDHGSDLRVTEHSSGAGLW